MLNRLAVRICAVKALLGNTFADGNVKDSAIVIVDLQNHPDEIQPFIAVYTDDQTNDALTLSLEIGVGSKMEVDDAINIPLTDAGIELRLDAIERQIKVVLADEGNPWSELFRTVFNWNGSTRSVRGASKLGSGERYAGRQILIEGKPLQDPEFGRALDGDGFWFRFLQNVDGDQSLVEYAKVIRALLNSTSGDEEWVLAQRALALSRPAADALGISPVYGDANNEILVTDIEADVTPSGP